MDAKTESFFALRDLVIGVGQETPQFNAILTIKGRDVGQVRNAGRGGVCIFTWLAPFDRDWAERKLYPLAAKFAKVRDPQFVDLFTRSPETALEALVFDEVEEERIRYSTRLPGEPASKALRPQYEQVMTFQPLPAGIRKGATVIFGRPNGEKIKGKVVKINRKSIKIVSLEARGTRPAGTKFTVSPSFVTVCPAG